MKEVGGRMDRVQNKYLDRLVGQEFPMSGCMDSELAILLPVPV